MLATMQSFLSSVLGLLVSVYLFASCSSVPPFQPSRSFQETSNFAETLAVCTEYRIPESHESKIKVSALVPWLRCIEVALRRFPDDASSRGFATFYRALSLRHDAVAAPYDELKQIRVWNEVIPRILEQFQKGSLLGHWSEAQEQFLLRELPRFAEYLEEEGVFGQPQTRDTRMRELLGLLYSDYAAFKLLSNSKQNNSKQVGSKWCVAYRDYLKKLSSVMEFAEYLDLLEQEEEMVSDEARKSQLRRVKERFERLKKVALEGKSELDHQGALAKNLNPLGCI